MAGDPYAPHLERARALFSGGEVLQAGQIWQAILKKQADHAEARAGLLQVKRWMDARKALEAPPAPAIVEPPPAPAPVAAAPPAAKFYKSTVPYKPAMLESAAEPTAPAEAPMAEPEPPPPPPAAAEPEPMERLLKEGCTLFDMGQAEDALLKWEQILDQDPAHSLALAYIAQARKELGYEYDASLPVAASYPSPPPSGPPVEPEELLRRASQLYEMGSLEESIATLERILRVDPGHADAQRFILLAKRELAESTPPVHPSTVPSAPAPLPAPTPVPPAPTPRLPEPPAASRISGFVTAPGRAPSDTLEQKLSQGERLLVLGRFEEAGFAFQMALGPNPEDARALDCLRRAQAQTRPEPAPMQAAPMLDATLSGVTAIHPPPAAAIVSPPAAARPVQPPAALTAPAAPARQGPELPRTLQDLSQHPLLGSTKVLVGAAALVVVLGVGLQVLQKQRKDEQLRAAVAHARENAVAPVVSTHRTFDVNETVAAVRQEADAILAFDPVRAYHRAKELLRRDSDDAVGAALLEKAKAALLADPVAGVSLTEFQRLLNAGDLEGAERVIDALLRARPEDPDLMQRSARLERVLAGLHASKGEWSEARTALQKGRALFPQDKSWQARIHLLEHLQSMPKAELPGWLPFIG